MIGWQLDPLCAGLRGSTDQLALRQKGAGIESSVTSALELTGAASTAVTSPPASQSKRAKRQFTLKMNDYCNARDKRLANLAWALICTGIAMRDMPRSYA